MQTAVLPPGALVVESDVQTLRREGVMGWLRTVGTRPLTPVFHIDPIEARQRLAGALSGGVSEAIGAPIVGPRELALADRLALAGFAFRDTKRRIPTSNIAVWLDMPFELDWTMRLYYAAWNGYLTSKALAGWVAWQDDILLPATTLRRMRDQLLASAASLLTRLELIEFLKHLDTLAAEW